MEPQEAPTRSTTVPERDTGVTPGRAGRGFVPCENVEQGIGARCLSQAPVPWQERAGKGTRSREKIGNRIMPGSVLGQKWVTSDDLHLQFCSEGFSPLLAQCLADPPSPGHGGGGKNLWNCIWEHPKSSHRSDPAQFLFPSQRKCCCFSRNVPVPQTIPSQFPGNLSILQRNEIFWPGPHTHQERLFQFEPSNYGNRVQLLKHKLRSCRFILKSSQDCSSFM